MNNDVEPGTLTLAANECWNRLRSTTVGRIAMVDSEGPTIYPVNFVVDHGSIVFRTGRTSKLAALAGGASVAFEADGQHEGQAWSVVVRARTESIAGPELLDAGELPLFPFQSGPKSCFVRVVAFEVTGRQFEVVDPDAWRTPVTGIVPAPSE